MLKNVALDSAATALAWQDEVKACDSTEHRADTINSNMHITSMVLPFPGGPNKSKPRAGALKPVKS